MQHRTKGKTLEGEFVRVAVSIPRDLDRSVEIKAAEMGKTKSQLFISALTFYVAHFVKAK